jgi:hypothetical protein
MIGYEEDKDKVTKIKVIKVEPNACSSKQSEQLSSFDEF